MAKKAKRGRRGSIGTEIFEQVEKIVAEEKIPRLQAFKRLSKETGRNVGTVSANYYRVAASRGATSGNRRRRGPGRPPGAPPKTGGNTGSAILKTLRELAVVINSQENELTKLRKENARFAEIRDLIGRA